MISENELRAAVEAIRSGGLVAFPTETVYGLGANALDAVAVERIYRVKGRPKTSPLIVHVDSVEAVRKLVREWPQAASCLAERFWPGPLTLVLPKRECIPAVVTAGLDTVGIRIPAHPVALAFLRESGVPVAAPSANRFTQLSPTRAEHVRQAFGPEVQVVLDGGRTNVGIESTVIGFDRGKWRMLRPGVISRPEIEACTGTLDDSLAASDEAPHSSPGLHRRHYQPRTPVWLSGSAGLPRDGVGAYVFWSQPVSGVRSIAMPPEARAYAGRLYDVLHQLDADHLDWIVIEPVPDGPEWEGVRDRLTRAAAGPVPDHTGAGS